MNCKVKEKFGVSRAGSDPLFVCDMISVLLRGRKVKHSWQTVIDDIIEDRCLLSRQSYGTYETGDEEMSDVVQDLFRLFLFPFQLSFTFAFVNQGYQPQA
jgi:hypothetical protein